MIYPALLFGVALLDEDNPGKKFWYFVVNYTSILLLFQCVTQLTIWNIGPQSTSLKIFNDLEYYNFGLVYIPT